MLVISLDEGGQFEGNTNRRGVVAGVAFSCQDKHDVWAEQCRIVNYLQRVCWDCAAAFPADLHPQRDNDGVTNKAALTAVQNRIKETLGDFFQQADRGRYYLYAVITEPEGVTMFENDEGDLLRDSYAGNRYLRMSQMAVRNMVINNPSLHSDSYQLDLATRVLKAEKAKDPQFFRQINDMGLNRVWGSGTLVENVYQLTDANTYIATLSSAILEEERENLKFDINVQSISYVHHENRNRCHSFMWLADIICSILGEQLRNTSEEATAWLILKRFKELTGHNENQVWCYDDVDFILRDAINSRIQGDVFRCLEKLYLIYSGEDNQSRFYWDVWADKVWQQLKQDAQPAQIEVSATRLFYQMQQLNVSMEECRFIADRLWELSESVGSSDRCRYLLHSCLLTLCNHAGQVQQAEDHYRHCEQYAEAVPLDEYLQLRNSYSITLLDRLCYGQALANTQKTLEMARCADQMRWQIFGKTGISQICGRSWSQLGQCYAYAGNHEKAEESFLQALEAFEENSVDWQITCSYLLHLYIDAKNKTAYNRWAQRYFGEADGMKQLKKLFDMDNTTFAFAALVYLKGWYRFDPKCFSAKPTARHLDEILDHGEGVCGHPWELICKYVALLAKCNCPSRPDIAEAALAQLKDIRQANPGGLLETICNEALETVASGKEPKDSKLAYMYR